MASSAQPQDAARSAPPAPVGLAARLMWVALLLGVVAAVVLGADDVRSTYGSNADDELGDYGRELYAVAMLVGLVLAALWALLRARVRRGDNWARVATWVVAATFSAVGLAQWLTP